MSFARIAIVGAGLIGSSIARAVTAAGMKADVRLFDASADVRARAAALDIGAIMATAEEAVRDADLVILATPVGAMAAATAGFADALADGVVLTDVGSTKRAVVDALAKITPARAFFIAGHPIAGTEQSGPEAGFASLFENRWTILTPQDDPRPGYANALARLSAFWTALGARVEIMDPDRHDLVLAITSHVPHLIAYNIVGTAAHLETVTQSEVMKFSAGGFRDFTRIASSDPTMWRDVFLNNREAVLEMLGRFTEDLAALQRNIRFGEGDQLFDLFTRTRAIRRGIIAAGQETAAPDFGRPHGKAGEVPE